MGGRPELLGVERSLTGAFLRGAELDRLTVERSIVGTIGDIDGYQLPDAKGYTSMVRELTGVTDEYRQGIREQILADRIHMLNVSFLVPGLRRDFGDLFGV